MGLSKYSILDAKVLDRNVTWLTKHKDTSWYEHKVRRHLTPLVVMNTNKAFGKQMKEDKFERIVVIEEDQDGDPWSSN